MRALAGLAVYEFSRLGHKSLDILTFKEFKTSSYIRV